MCSCLNTLIDLLFFFFQAAYERKPFKSNCTDIPNYSESQCRKDFVFDHMIKECNCSLTGINTIPFVNIIVIVCIIIVVIIVVAIFMLLVKKRVHFECRFCIFHKLPIFSYFSLIIDEIEAENVTEVLIQLIPSPT